jgi:hypothetical protein
MELFQYKVGHSAFSTDANFLLKIRDCISKMKITGRMLRFTHLLKMKHLQ